MARTNVLLACVPWRAMQELLRERPEWERGLIEQAYRALQAVDAAGLKEIAEGRQC